MKLGTKPREEPEVSLTALIDVVFLLLIFFMASTTFERQSQLAIELPSSTNPPQPEEEEVLDLTIDAEGRYALNGRALINPSVGALSRALAAAAADRPDFPAVTISADARSSHRAVVMAMNAAREAGLFRLAFATRFEPEDSRADAN
ncbi:MAG: ExbD/TolR family protein [Gammaproteobacteria bacterium]